MKQTILLTFFAAAIALPALAQADSGYYRPLTLAPAVATSSSGVGAGAEDEKSQAAELAKKLQNPVASLIQVPLQPFVSYSTKTFTTFALNTESTYDWSNHQWTVPLNVSVSQLLKVGKQPISLALGFKYYADGPSGGPDWGLRFNVTFLFPK